MSSKLLIVGGLALCVLSACGRTESANLSRVREEVLYGQLSGPEDDAVLMVQSNTGTSLQNCTGTLVAPNLVITARHCVSNYVDLKFTCDSSGNLVSGPGGQMGTLLAASAISIRKGTFQKPVKLATGTQIFAAATSTMCQNDIALVVLNQAINDLPIMPIRLYTGTQPGDVIHVVGYGLDADAGFGVRYSRSGLIITQVGSSQFRPAGDAIPPRMFETDGPALCIGDSGGPAFNDRDAIIGVYSQVVGDCAATNARDLFTEIAPFTADIVLPAFAAAGYEPWLEGNSEPGLYGTGGTGNTGGDSSIGGSNASGGAPATSASGGSTSADTSAGGAPIGTGGDTSGPAVYDQAPPSGGSCACRTVGHRRGGLGALLAIATVLGLRRRRLLSRHG